MVQKAMVKELASLKQHNVYDLVSITSVPLGHEVIVSGWVFKQKADGTLKARLVAQGWGHVPGVDCGGTFAPECRIGSIRMVMAIAAEHNMDILKLDVQTAYLQSPVEENVYVKPAPGNGSQGNVMKLYKSLYGLRQSGKIGSAQLTTRWRTSNSYRDGRTRAFMSTDQRTAWSCFYYQVYVDDVLMVGSNTELIQTLKKALMERFAMRDMGNVSLIQGMKITGDLAEGRLKSARKRLSNPSCSDSACPNVILCTRPERARSSQ